MSEKKNNKWQHYEKTIKGEVKFAPKDESITIYNDEPMEQEIDGKYGKQTMYIVNTNIGLVALNRTQFLKVAANFSIMGYVGTVRFSR
jgi:hypothetical protein